jgi:hypothetical protein
MAEFYGFMVDIAYVYVEKPRENPWDMGFSHGKMIYPPVN